MQNSPALMEIRTDSIAGNLQGAIYYLWLNVLMLREARCSHDAALVFRAARKDHQHCNAAIAITKSANIGNWRTGLKPQRKVSLLRKPCASVLLMRLLKPASMPSALILNTEQRCFNIALFYVQPCSTHLADNTLLCLRSFQCVPVPCQLRISSLSAILQQSIGLISIAAFLYKWQRCIKLLQSRVRVFLGLNCTILDAARNLESSQ